MIEVGGQRVKIVTGSRTQTVRVLTAAGHNGSYEAVWRLAPPFVTAEIIDAREFSSTTDMGAWLEAERGAVREEGDSLAGPSATPPKPATVEQPAHGDTVWFRAAVAATERAISELALEFIEQPYMHRVEHSLHCRLFELMSAQQAFRHSIRVGNWLTQPIHKEWPEYIARPENGNRRGAFDLAVISPEVDKPLRVVDFCEGRIRPCIAVELGLNYGYSHLDGDRRKFSNSKMEHGYLVHFARVEAGAPDEAVERLVEATPRAVYVHHVGNRARVRLLGESEVREVIVR